MGKGLVFSGIIFLVLGALAFFISEEIRVWIEVLPVSMMLAIVLVVGAILLIIGLTKFVGNPFP